MEASFVIGFHTARMDNLLQTLRFLTQDHSDVVNKCQLVTVCQNNIEFQPLNLIKEFDELRHKFIKADHFDMDLDQMMLPLVTNYGVEHCKSNKVILLESDRLLPTGYFQNVINELKPGIMITCKNMKKLKAPATDENIRNGLFEYKDESRDSGWEIGVRNMWSGNTAFWKQDFIDVDKMDVGYVGYGFADTDMTRKMSEFGVQSVFRDKIELHLWHPQQTYGNGDQKKLFIENGIKYCEKWNVPRPDWLQNEFIKHRRFFI